ncbi:MAG: hypothetical protein KKC68_01855 [Candidatus Thermoplasmatota archaeon]|nr:hypothetical protein [Candidatus Thermoplasmatota archaeon]
MPIGDGMPHIFDRNMFIMLFAIMVGAIIITYFVADIQHSSTIETISQQYNTEIEGIYRMNENFTDNFLQGSVSMDSAREVREIANYHFDFALFWFNNALNDANVWFYQSWINGTHDLIQLCIFNCTTAMNTYSASFEKFGASKPFFSRATSFTNLSKYIEVLGYYISFAQSGQNITLLRYNASKYLRQAAENLSLGNMENFSMMYDLFNQSNLAYGGAVKEYDEKKKQIDGYLFISEIREIPDGQ